MADNPGQYVVIIPTPDADCPAHRALRMEGIEIEVVTLGNDFDYERLLADLWQRGNFILVEWDIVPWPGLIRELIACPARFCVSCYHNGGFDGGWGFSLGCVKFSTDFIRDHEVDLHLLRSTDWRNLDTVFWKELRHPPAHIHHPGVGHASRNIETSLVLG